MSQPLSLSDVHVSTGTDVPIPRTPGHSLSLGLSWDFYEGQPKVDLDCSALMFDWGGVLVDACYYNQLTCLSGAVRHSGDNKDGRKEGFDETIQVNFDAMPPEVSFIALVVNAFKGGTFEAVESAYAVVSDVPPGGGKNKALADCAVGCGQSNTAVVMAVLYKVNPANPQSEWMFRNVGEMTSGVNFQESFPAVRRAIDAFVDPELVKERTAGPGKSFEMRKGDSVEIPKNLFRGGDDLFIGLGWTARGNFE